MNIQDTDLSVAIWRKSAYSNNGGACVEVARNLPGVVAVRDSKNPGGPALIFTRRTGKRSRWRLRAEPHGG